LSEQLKIKNYLEPEHKQGSDFFFLKTDKALMFSMQKQKTYQELNSQLS